MLDMVERTGRKSGNVKIEVVTVTPEIAAAWLDKNTDNRKIAKRLVGAFSRDMTNRKWQLTGDSIKFATDGTLIDGQHRLMACKESGRPFDTLVVYGLPHKLKSVVDTGKSRSATDVMAMNNISNPSGTAAALRLLAAEKTGVTPVGGIATMTHSELLEIFDRHNKIYLYVPYGSQLPRGVSAAAVGFINYVGSTILGKKGRAQAMVEVLKSGIPDYDGDPIHRYRERIISNYEGSIGTYGNRVAAIQTLKYCWNMFAKRTPVERLHWQQEYVPIDGLDASKL